MFGGEEQADPTEADIGVFLSETVLMEWHKEMQVKYPTIFTKDEKLFGNDMEHQHTEGTKLMSYFDDDPNKPMRIEVLGSRMKVEFGSKSPVYVVKFQRQAELTQIELTSAHEEGGWVVGWDVPCPTGSS